MPYSTTLELETYASERGYTIVGDVSVLLVRANDWIEAQSYKGYRTDDTQTTSFPRTGIVVDGIEVDSSTVPAQVKKAEMQMAIELDKGNDPYAATERTAIREKVGTLEVEYSDTPYAIQNTIIRSVKPLLKGFLKSSGGITIVAG